MTGLRKFRYTPIMILGWNTGWAHNINKNKKDFLTKSATLFSSTMYVVVVLGTSFLMFSQILELQLIHALPLPFEYIWNLTKSFQLELKIIHRPPLKRLYFQIIASLGARTHSKYLFSVNYYISF